jgi:single-strand DNA-binding protein
MAGSVNKVILVGNLGRDPEPLVPEWRQGGQLRIATSRSWKDRNSGERKERTEWHTVVIFNEVWSAWPSVSCARVQVYIEGAAHPQVAGPAGQ